MIQALSVVVSKKHELPTTIANKARKIVEEKLEDGSFSGIWRMTPLHKCRANKKEFAAKRVERSVNGINGIKVVVRPEKDEDTSWEYILFPPQDYNLYYVLDTLKGQKVEKQPEPPAIPENTSPIYHIRIGETYQGVIKKIYSTKILVELDHGIVGAVGLSEYTHGRVSNFHLINELKVGNTLPVMVMKIRDNKIDLSHRYADAMPKFASVEKKKFVGVPDANGVLSMSGFCKDPSNVLWMLRIIAESYIDLYNGQYVPTKSMMSRIRSEVIKKYNAKEVKNDFQQLRGLIGRDFVIKYQDEEGKSLGYAITDKGWQQIGGKDLYFPDEFEEEIRQQTGAVQKTTSMPTGTDQRPITNAALSDNEKGGVIDDVIESATNGRAPHSEKRGNNIDDVVEYCHKLKRLAELEELLSDVRDLVKEHHKIERWLQDNRHLSSDAIKIQKLFS